MGFPLSHKYFFITACLIIIFVLNAYAKTEDTFIHGNVAVFSIEQRSVQLNALSARSVNAVVEAFSHSQRFIPVEKNRLKQALQKIKNDPGPDPYKKMAQLLKVDLYVLVASGRRGRLYYGNIRLIPLKKKYRYLAHNITVRSSIVMNLPVKLAREVTRIHKKIPLSVRVIKRDKGDIIINAGQWHGIKPGSYRTMNRGRISILSTGRYRSRARLASAQNKASSLTIKTYPSLRDQTADYSRTIEDNAYKRYGLDYTLLKGQNVEKRFMEALCLVNPGANLLIPGYAAFLATGHLGFEKASPDIPGVILSSMLLVTHLTLAELMTSFKINYSPSIMDSDKTIQMRDLQIYLFATIPFTLSASFFNQLAYQFTYTRHLPPFFRHRNEASLLFSVITPGGGLFYKGYRLLGWSYYLSEMFLGGYAVYHKDNRIKGKYSLIALGALKVVELINAFFIKSSYNFFNTETEGALPPASLSFSMRELETDENIYRLSMVYRFN